MTNNATLPSQQVGMILANNSYPDPIFDLPDNWKPLDVPSAFPNAQLGNEWNLQKNGGDIENSQTGHRTL